jgi:flavin-dependent dehydrogenase
MLEPIFAGVFRNTTEVFSWAKEHGKTGLYYVEIPDLDPFYGENTVYFWLNDSIPYFGIWIFPKKNLNMVSLNAMYLNSNIPYEKGQLLYTSLDEFCNHTINISHPATEWLLFNQDLWNTTV